MAFHPTYHICYGARGHRKLAPYLIVDRWRKNAKVVGQPTINNEEEGEKLIGARFDTLMHDYRLLCNLTSRSKETFLGVRESVRALRLTGLVHCAH